MVYDMNPFALDRIDLDDNVVKIAILAVPDKPGTAAKVFSLLGEANIPIEMIIQSVMRGDVKDIAFLVSLSHLEEAVEISRKMPSNIGAQGVTFDTEVSRLTLYGSGFSKRPGLPAEVFAVFADIGVNLDMIVATSETISCVINSSFSDLALKALEEHFCLS